MYNLLHQVFNRASPASHGMSERRQRRSTRLLSSETSRQVCVWPPKAERISGVHGMQRCSSTPIARTVISVQGGPCE